MVSYTFEQLHGRSGLMRPNQLEFLISRQRSAGIAELSGPHEHVGCVIDRLRVRLPRTLVCKDHCNCVPRLIASSR